jgi:3-isopropylmalate dehydratase small subunit
VEPFRSVTGVAAALLQDDVNTDQIIPSAYLKDMAADLSTGLLAYLRRTPEGVRKRDFVLEKPQFARAPILLVGRNFGCGSSREHAVWALRAFGFRCVVGPDPAEFFRENCLRNGVLPVALDAATMATLAALAVAVDGREPFTVDLESCEIRGPSGFVCRFSLPPAERAALLDGLDDIAVTLKHLPAIAAWETRTATERPFMQSAVDRLFADRKA